MVEQHTRNEKLLYARGDFNVAKSEEAGESWTNIYGSWDGYGAGYFLTIYPSDPDIIWGGGAGATLAPHLFMSSDGGKNWSSRNNVFNGGDATCYDALVHPDDPSKVLVGMSFGVQYSDDGGSNWSNVSNEALIKTLAQSPGSPETVYASGRNANGTVFFARSTDFGQTWQTNEFPDSPADITVHDVVATTKDGHEILYLGTNKGVFSYTFEGE